LKRAAGSLASALGSTLTDLSGEFGSDRGNTGSSEEE
jgi:hypothetical protein